MTMSGLIIRPAVPDDATDLARVHVFGWQWAYRGIVADEVLDALDIDERAERTRSHLSDPTNPLRTFVAHVDDELIGFVTCGPSRDDDVSAQCGEVAAIYLKAESIARLGIGTALWRTAIEHLTRAGLTRVSVWVLDDNDRARRFYERMGLALDGATKIEDRATFQLHQVRYFGEISAD